MLNSLTELNESKVNYRAGNKSQNDQRKSSYSVMKDPPNVATALKNVIGKRSSQPLAALNKPSYQNRGANLSKRLAKSSNNR